MSFFLASRPLIPHAVNCLDIGRTTVSFNFAANPADRGLSLIHIYKIPITRVKSNTECDVNYYSWGSARISHILRNPFYKGAHLVCRTHQKGIRSNTYDIIPREEWEVIEGCHEAIVTLEEWEQVQDIIAVSYTHLDVYKRQATRW